MAIWYRLLSPARTAVNVRLRPIPACTFACSVDRDGGLHCVFSPAFAAFIFQQATLDDVERDRKQIIERTSGRDIYALYDICDELGAGTYATVRRAVNKETGEEVAVKIIDKKRFRLLPSFDLSSLLREAEVLQKLSHPFIISLKDLFQTENTLYIVTVCARSLHTSHALRWRGRSHCVMLPSPSPGVCHWRRIVRPAG